MKWVDASKRQPDDPSSVTSRKTYFTLISSGIELASYCGNKRWRDFEGDCICPILWMELPKLEEIE